MTSQVVVVLWLILAFGVILWGLLSRKCSHATKSRWKPARPAERCEKVAEALKSGNLERMLLALDQRCPPAQRSKLLQAVVAKTRERRGESHEMEKLYNAMTNQCDEEAPLLEDYGLANVLAEISETEPAKATENVDLAHTHKA